MKEFTYIVVVFLLVEAVFSATNRIEIEKRLTKLEGKK